MKKRVGIDLDARILQALQKRASREILSVKELIEEILRRSVLSSAQKQLVSGKGDKFIEYFSRSSYKKSKKQKNKQNKRKKKRAKK